MNDVLLGVLTEILDAEIGYDVDTYFDSSIFFNRFPCGLGRKGSLIIDPYLNILDCMNVRRNVGNLIADDSNDILHNYFQLYFPVVEDIPYCSECVYKYVCKGGCRDLAYNNTGSIVGKQPYCKLFKRLYQKYFSFPK